MQGFTANYISSPSEVLRCRDGLLDFSAAFDRVSHGGLLFKLKSISVGGSVHLFRVPLQPQASSRV